MKDCLTIVADTRERLPYEFNSGSVYDGTMVEQKALLIGDYSLSGLEHLVAVERKSLPDLVLCLGRERDRFERELLRAQGLEAFAVVVEGTFYELAHGDYRSQLNPHAAVQSVSAFMARMRVPFVFAGSRDVAMYAVWSFLRQFVQGKHKELKTIEKTLGMQKKSVSHKLNSI